MQEEQTHAWIFLSVTEEPSKLDEVIGMADAINHAIPTQKELQNSLGWLKGNGYISKSGKAYRYSEKGKALREKISKKKGSILKAWEAVEKEFIKINSNSNEKENITPEEIEQSYNKYTKRFWNIYNKISGGK